MYDFFFKDNLRWHNFSLSISLCSWIVINYSLHAACLNLLKLSGFITMHCLSVGSCHSNKHSFLHQNNICYIFLFSLFFTLILLSICGFGFSWNEIAFTKMALHFHTYRTV